MKTYLNKITAVLFSNNPDIIEKNISNLKNTDLISDIIVVTDKKSDHKNLVFSNNQFSGVTIRKVISQIQTRYAMFIVGNQVLKMYGHSFEKYFLEAKKTNAGWIYSDFDENRDTKKIKHPLIDYQPGSIRDDFDFGYCFIVDIDLAKKCAIDLFSLANQMKYSGLYDLRLSISRKSSFYRIQEPLYLIQALEENNLSKKMFEYVDPKNREVQVEMEKVATHHLKEIKAFINSADKKNILFDDKFQKEASVVIPVKNRANTITDAIKSALDQKTNFNFNIIVVNNHSDDGTIEKLEKISSDDKRVIHLIPDSKNLGIGGCWNEAIINPECGKFSVQLDSDDLYADENTLQKMVDKFYEDKCAMVIGSYKLTDLNLNEIPPGLVDHKEWTDENGHNNALRVNGLGAPRAFYTPIIREIKFPNVSYGEDYAVGLAISRQYKIGRIYDPIYLCRRWEGNTDTLISLEKLNANNFYKDSLRSKEILIRQDLNKQNKL